MHHTSRTGQRRRARPTAYVACYAFYAVVLVLCYVVFLIWKEVATLLLSAVSHNNFSNTAFYGLVVVLLGMVLFIVAMGAEPYMRNGVAKQRLLPRFATIAGWLVGAIALGLAVQELIIVLV